MRKLDYIYRPVKIEDFNRMVDVVNALIDEVSEKACVGVDWWDEDVKDRHNYTNLDISLPYETSILIHDMEGYQKLTLDYHLPHEISKKIFDYLGLRSSVMFNIHLEESDNVKDTVITQGEITLESLQSTKKNATPKKGGKKKDAGTKSTRTSTKKDSGTNKKGVWKRKS